MVTRFLWQGMTRNLRLFVLLVLAVGILVPLSNLLLPPGSAFRMPSWAVQLVGKYLCYATLALAMLPMAARTTAAHAQTAPQRVQTSDLNLASPTGQSTFIARADGAVHTTPLGRSRKVTCARSTSTVSSWPRREW